MNNLTGGRNICKSCRRKNKKNKKEEFIELKTLGKRESLDSFESNYKTKPLIANKNSLESLHKTVQTESVLTSDLKDKLRIYNKGNNDSVAPSKFKSHHYINDSGS